MAGIKSYGRAPTFLLLTGYEQVRSIAAHLAGDQAAANDVRLVLPETGVCNATLDEVAPGGLCCDGAAPNADEPCCERPAASRPTVVLRRKAGTVSATQTCPRHGDMMLTAPHAAAALRYARGRASSRLAFSQIGGMGHPLLRLRGIVGPHGQPRTAGRQPQMNRRIVGRPWRRAGLPPIPSAAGSMCMADAALMAAGALLGAARSCLWSLRHRALATLCRLVTDRRRLRDVAL